MKAKLTNTFIAQISPAESRLDIFDTEIKQLCLRVEPSGKKVYYINCYLPSGKRANRKLGDATIFTPAQAREMARQYLVELKMQGDPKDKIKKVSPTLQKIYDEYKVAGGSKFTIENVKNAFNHLMGREFEQISLIEIEKWRKAEIEKGKVKISTVNHYCSCLKSLLNWAVNHEIINKNPLGKLKKLPETDSEQKTRYLTKDEYARLLAALDEREKNLREARQRTRQHAKGADLPDLKGCAYADYFKPLIIVALNTGIRKSALLSLRWEDIDLERETLTLRASTAKSKKQSILPINRVVVETLKAWQKQCPSAELVWPSPQTGGIMDNCYSSWKDVLKKAKITKFRWHDMRHNFASQLVMKGVDLNTVRELMTHSEIEMTLRYAHLAPEKTKEAVNLLD